MKAADTYGWDTTFAVDLAFFNRLISHKSMVLNNFAYATRHGGAQDHTLSCTVTGWTIVEVYGAQITATAELSEATLTAPRLNEPVDVSGFKLEMIVNLALVHERGDDNKASVCTDVSKIKNDRWGNVSLEAPDDDSAVLIQMLTAGFQQYLLEPKSSQQFLAIFSELNVALEEGGSNLLSPKQVKIAGSVQETRRNAIGVLAKTRDADVTGLRNALSPYALPEKCDAALILSPTCFFSAVLIPALVHVFDSNADTAATDFNITKDQISNTVQLKMEIKGEDGELHHGEVPVDGLSIRFEADRLVMEMTNVAFKISVVDVDIYTVFIHYSERLGITLLEDPDDPGKFVMMFVSDEAPLVEHEEHEELPLIITKVVASLILFAAQILVFKFMPKGLQGKVISEFGAKIISAVVAVLLTGLGIALGETSKLTHAILDGDLSGIPSVDTLLSTSIKSVHWAEGIEFTCHDVTFASGLVCHLTHKTT